MGTCAALLSLWFWVNAGVGASRPGSKCGIPQVWGLTDRSLRIVGGAEATHGSHPWLLFMLALEADVQTQDILMLQVSLQHRGSHFCGGSVLSDRWILTAAHCFASLSKEFLSDVRVVVGEFDRRASDEEEQAFLIKSVSVHERYHRALPMSYDIALIKLETHIRWGANVRPICLPLPDESISSEASCIVAGWGRVKEKGHLPAVLREVQIDLVDPAKCKYVLQTVKSSLHNQGPARPRPAMTVLCAGPEGGGKDACQGDSGGPLVCLAGSGGGRQIALGVTSWGKVCGRSWGNNSSRHPSRRGSPGVFTDVRLLLPWIKRKLREAGELQASVSRLCSVKDGPVPDSEGVIRNPAHPGDHYDNNQLCVWSISVPPGHGILLEFDVFDLENDSYCHYDRLTISVGTLRPVGIFCGSVLPGPVLLKNTQNALLLLSSDIDHAGSGFVIRHSAVQGRLDPVCGSVVLVEDQTAVHSPNYPQFYSNDCVLHWVVYAPQGHVVKLDFVDFELEESDGCLYDSLAVLGDVEGTQQIAVVCGGGLTPHVLSYHNVMVLRFTSDSSVTHKGFSAALSFVSHEDLHNQHMTDAERQRGSRRDHQQDLAERRHAASYGSKSATLEDTSVPIWTSTPDTSYEVNMDVADPVVQPSGSRTQSHQTVVDHETSEDPRVDTDLDDDDYSGDP